MKYHAYLRCSTNAQTTERQELQLKQWCKANDVKVADVTIWRENQSGKNDRRPIYQEMMKTMQAGECLLLAELSRCHRNMENVRKMWQELSERNIYIVVMNYKMLDTRPKGEDTLANKLIVNIMLDVLAFVSEEERLAILERTEKGRESAKLKGVKFGRPVRNSENIPAEFVKVYKSMGNKVNKKQLLALVNAELKCNQKKEISRATLYRYIEEIEPKTASRMELMK